MLPATLSPGESAEREERCEGCSGILVDRLGESDSEVWCADLSRMLRKIVALWQDVRMLGENSLDGIEIRGINACVVPHCSRGDGLQLRRSLRRNGSSLVG